MREYDADTLSDLVSRSEKFRDEYLDRAEALVKGYAGGAEHDQDEARRESTAYEYVSLMVPQVAFNNPRVMVASRKAGPAKDVAVAIGHGMNRWVRDVDLRRTLQRIAYDMLFGFGCALSSQSPQVGVDPADASAPRMPQVNRLSPRRFCFDADALSFDEARWSAHMWVMRKTDLEKIARGEPGWDVKAVEGLGTDIGLDKLHRPNHATNRSTAKEVVGYDVWCRDGCAEGEANGCNGAMYTLVSDGSGAGVMLRKPRWYYGPRWGPHTLFGAHTIPDNPLPLSPLLATKAANDELNDHASSLSRAARLYKRFVGVTGAAKDLSRAVKDARDLGIVTLPSVRAEDIAKIEVGGVTAEQITASQIMFERVNRALGMTDAQRGNVTGKGSATENQLADSSATTRIAHLKQQFTDATRQCLRTVAWYLYHDDRVVFSLGPDAAEELGMADPVYMGGIVDDGSGASFDDLELDIDPYSMERTSEALLQKRVMEFTQLIMQIAPAIPQMPWVDWSGLLDMIGDAMNHRSAGELIDVEAALKGATQQINQRVQDKRPTLGRFANSAPSPGSMMGNMLAGVGRA